MARLRWATFLLGAWVAGSLIVSVVASENFYTIDMLLSEMRHTSFRAAVLRLGQQDARDMLRYLSSELNRLYFQLWVVMQIVIAALVLRLVWSAAAARMARWIVLGMLGVVMLMFLWLAPEITALGRSLDFVPRDPPPPAFGRFGMLHAAYAALEVLKGAAGLVVAAMLARTDGKERPDGRNSRTRSETGIWTSLDR